MAIVPNVLVKRYTNVVEYTGGTLVNLNDEMRVHAHASQFTFAIESVGAANFKLAFEATYNGGTVWYEIDTSKTITAAGEYVYYYTGKASSTIRIRISQITSGTVNVTPHIGICFNG